MLSVTEKDTLERLLLANLPKSLASNVTCEFEPKVLILPQQIPPKTIPKYVFKEMEAGWYPMPLKPMIRNGPRILNCLDQVCCTVEYELGPSRVNDYCSIFENIPILRPIYHQCFPQLESQNFCLTPLNEIAFKTLPFESCLIMMCPKITNSICSIFADPQKFRPGFKYLKLTGSFEKNAIVYPSVVQVNYRLLHPKNNWIFTKKLDPHSGRITASLELDDRHLKFPRFTLSTLSFFARIHQLIESKSYIFSLKSQNIPN